MRRGFTLIEIVVIVGVVGVVLTSATIVLSTTFKAKNKVNSNNVLVARGNFIIDKLRDNLLEADPETIICGAVVTYTTKKGRENVLSCNAGSGNEQIASNSGIIVGLVGSDNIAVDCGSFAVCEYFTDSTKVMAVNIGFSLSINDDMGTLMSRSFETKVMIRE